MSFVHWNSVVQKSKKIVISILWRYNWIFNNFLFTNNSWCTEDISKRVLSRDNRNTKPIWHTNQNNFIFFAINRDVAKKKNFVLVFIGDRRNIEKWILTFYSTLTEYFRFILVFIFRTLDQKVKKVIKNVVSVPFSFLWVW